MGSCVRCARALHAHGWACVWWQHRGVVVAALLLQQVLLTAWFSPLLPRRDLVL